jgi:hypothetical protein
MKSKLFSILAILLASVLLAQFLLIGTASIATALPPRPTAVPTRQLSRLHGGFIELHIDGSPATGVWTVVQWQDAQDDWHDVTGWQGTLDEGNIKTWWVGEENLGAGPFRWVVMQDESVLGVSDDFFLPAQPGQKVVVTILID